MSQPPEKARRKHSDAEQVAKEAAVQDGAPGGIDANHILAAASAQIREQIQGLQPEQANKAAQIAVQFAAAQYSGPLPLPQHYAEYEKILPGAADRILSMAEKEQNHRHSREKKVNNYPYWGLAVGAILSVLCFTFSYLLFVNGRPVGGGAMLSVSVLGVIGWFVNGRIGTHENGEPEQDSRPKQSKPTARGGRKRR